MQKKKILSDEYYMSLALAEAMKAQGQTSPNPMVGALLVKNQKILARGFHRRAGLPHAEIEVLRQVKDPRGSTLFVTLEPCCHLNKRTPPCTEALLRSGLRRVVIGTLDPNPQVSGRGLKALKKAGIETRVGVLREDCSQLNLFYNHWIRTGRPWVMLKSAASLDGRVALKNKKSRWITGPKARDWVHRLRSRVDAVLVGVGTVLADDPQLTARLKKNSRQPLRIVLDPHLRISERAKVLSKHGAPCWIVLGSGREKSPKARRISRKNAQLLVSPMLASGRLDLKKLLRRLGRENITSLLVEGGPETWKSFLQQKVADEWLVFLAPKLLGGDAMALLPELGIKSMKRCPILQLKDFEILGEDLLLGFRFPK